MFNFEDISVPLLAIQPADDPLHMVSRMMLLPFILTLSLVVGTSQKFPEFLPFLAFLGLAIPLTSIAIPSILCFISHEITKIEQKDDEEKELKIRFQKNVE